MVENQNLSRTAEELNISQPAVSKQIQTLEDIYGVLLLERSGRKLKTTEAGDTLYYCAREIVKVIEKTNRIMEDISESRKGNLFLGASTIPGHYLMPRYIKGFKDQFPNVNIQMEIADTEKIYSRVAERELDVGIVGAWMNNRKVEGYRWMDDELVIVVPKNHRLANRTHIEMRSLISEHWIFRSRGSGTRMASKQLLSLCGINWEELNIQAELGSTEAVVAAVEAGMGIAMVSSLVVGQSERNCVALKIIDQGAKRDLFLIYPKQKIRRKTVEKFLDFLINSHRQ